MFFAFIAREETLNSLKINFAKIHLFRVSTTNLLISITFWNYSNARHSQGLRGINHDAVATSKPPYPIYRRSALWGKENSISLSFLRDPLTGTLAVSVLLTTHLTLPQFTKCFKCGHYSRTEDLTLSGDLSLLLYGPLAPQLPGYRDTFPVPSADPLVPEATPGGQVFRKYISKE